VGVVAVVDVTGAVVVPVGFAEVVVGEVVTGFVVVAEGVVLLLHAPNKRLMTRMKPARITSDFFTKLSPPRLNG